MSNITETPSPSGTSLNDTELMDLLNRVRRGELSPEEAERLLSGLSEAEPTAGSSGSDKPVGQGQGHTASAPLGQARRGTLIVDTLAADFAIHSGEPGPDLFQARYDRSFPSVWVDGSTVTARFNYFSLGALREWLRQQQGNHPRAEFSLNTAIPWQLELHSHMSHLVTDLRGLRLAGLEGNGSMNHIVLTLDAPAGDVPIHYDAIATAFEIHCPARCALRVEIMGNTNGADIGGRKFASKSAWQTPDFDTTPDRYYIIFTGEASSLSVIYE